MSAVITGVKNYLVTKIDHYTKYQTKQLHAHTSTWLGDHQGIPSAPTNSLYELHMARYQVILSTIFPFVGYYYAYSHI